MNGMDWESFASGLAEDLAELPAGAIVVIREPREGGRRRFVQFVQESEGLFAYVVTNDLLEEEARASARGEERIAKAGWLAPRRAEGHETWWYMLKWPAPSDRYHHLADMIVTALHEGYEISAPTSWSYLAWNEREANRPLRLVRLEERGLTPERI